MRAARVYVDTSVFGGVADEEFTDASDRFFQQVQREGWTLLVSAELLRELAGAPQGVRKQFEMLPRECLESVAVSAEVETLADAYLAAGILGLASRADAIHVAAHCG